MTDVPEPSGPTPTDPLVGSVLAGRYRIVRRLGVGAMGSVYLGEHLRFGRLDAIKVLREEMARDREATERFLRGARNVSVVKHPNVCTVYDFGDTEDGRQFLAMEFVEGETLAELLEREGRLAPARAVEVARQIAGALDAAHAQGIVHRDLKPGNVMIARDRSGGDQIKVVDFDIAKGSAEGEGAEVTRTGFVVGTPEYMSPEQLIGDPLDGRSDVYSLAVVFVRILTGALPVRATSTQDLMVERLTAEPLTLAELAPELAVPDALQAAVDRGLQRRREDRPATAGEFARELVRSLDDARAAPPPAASPPSSSPPSSPAERPPAGGARSPIPATTVEPVSGGESGAAATPAPAGEGRPGWMPWAVGVAGVAAVAIGLSLFLPDGGAAPDGREADVSGPVGPGAGNDPGDPPGPTGEGGPAGDTARTGDTVTNGDTDVPDPTDDDPPPDDPPGTGTPTDSPPALSATEVEDALFNQITALTDRPGSATWASAADTARMAWDRNDLPDGVRALAAYVMAETLDARGQGPEALTWARRAVGLAPDNAGFRTLLERLGGRP